VGFGATTPLDEKKNERALFLNRRVEFQITREHHVRGGATPAPGAAPEGGQNEKPPDPTLDKKETPPDPALEKKE
jgi:hypothetical protein